jgi:hypothetical protein
MAVSSKDFVIAYMQAYKSGQTVSDLAKVVGITYNNAQSKTRYLRERGVDLPRLAGANERINSAELNRLIEQTP